MKDFLNQDLAVGDHVVMVGGGKNFRVGMITKFTPKKVRVQFYDWQWETIQRPDQLIKMYPEQMTWWVMTRGQKP
jgi:hypothetical protein